MNDEGFTELRVPTDILGEVLQPQLQSKNDVGVKRARQPK